MNEPVSTQPLTILLSCVGRRGYLAEYFRSAAPNARILGTSNSPWTPGFMNCDSAFLMPDIRSDEYIAAVKNLCEQERVNAILSCLDVDIERLAPHRQEFIDAGLSTFVVSEQVSRTCFDKLETVRFLERKQFSGPRTFGSVEMARQQLQAGELEFPLFIKPRYGFGSNHLFVARNDAQLEVFFSYAPDMMIQEKLGGDEYSFDILNDLEHNVVSVIVKKKILMRSGETDQAVTVLDDELIHFGVRLGQELGHVGPLDVDFFLVDGQPHILELNPRFGGGYPVSQMAGAQFPELMLRMITNQEVAPQFGRFEGGIRMMKEICAKPCNNLQDKIVDFRTGA